MVLQLSFTLCFALFPCYFTSLMPGSTNPMYFSETKRNLRSKMKRNFFCGFAKLKRNCFCFTKFCFKAKFFLKRNWDTLPRSDNYTKILGEIHISLHCPFNTVQKAIRISCDGNTKSKCSKIRNRYATLGSLKNPLIRLTDGQNCNLFSSK